MSQQNRQSGGNGRTLSTPGSRIRLAPGLDLSPKQLALLDQALPKDRDILVKQEFRSGYSGAIVVLVSVGAGRAPLVVKLAHPHDLQREYEAYEEYVRQVSPQNIAHLQGEPLISDDGQLGLLQYTFAGGESHLPTTSLQAYYESAGAVKTSEVLNRIFRVFGRHWWADNRARSYVLDEYYDRLLPVHLEAQPAEETSRPDQVITAGESDVLVVTQIQIGQTIHLRNFEVIKTRNQGRRLTLLAAPPPNQATAPIRIRVQCQQPTDYRPGDLVDAITVIVTATRISLLGDAAKEALPGFDPQSERFSLPTGNDTRSNDTLTLPNPLPRLPEQLYSVVETKMSIIHGDLNLQNVLVDEPTGFAWLIDFAETRVGPTLLDLQRLEVQVLTKLLPAHGDIPLLDIADMMTRLHADPPQSPPPLPPLHEPYELLVTIRRLARQYLIDDLDWNEYYYGLVTALIGALKYDELDNQTKAIALTAAAAAEDCVGKPLGSGRPFAADPSNLAPIDAQSAIQPSPGTATETHVSPKQSGGRRSLWIGMAFALALVGLAAFFGWQFSNFTAPAAPAPPTAGPTVANASADDPAAVDAAAVDVATQLPALIGSDAQTQTPESGEVIAATTGPALTQTNGTGETHTRETEEASVAGVESDAAQDTPTPAARSADPTETLPAPTATRPAQEESPPTPTAGSDSEPADRASLVPLAGDTRINEIDDAAYLFVPGGEFLMGSDDGRPDEGPAHIVSVDPFWIMRTEVTNAQYARCVDAGACAPPASAAWSDGDLDNHPVTHITWEQANDYAQWTGGRLPTEAQWELAARSDDERAYPWGNDLPDGSRVNFNFTVGSTMEVGSYPDGSGPYGILDMAGNVEEWVADRYDGEYYSSSPSQDPRGPDAGPLRAVRGGSFYSNGTDIRTFAREKALPDAHFDSVGFRVAASAE